MKIGLVIYGSLNTVSGGYLYNRQLVKYLRRQGHMVQIISLPWHNYLRHLTDNFSRALREHLLAAKFDILLQDEMNHPSLFWLNQQLRGRYPIITITHLLRIDEQWPRWQRPLYRWVEAQYLRSLDGFIFNSVTTQQSVEAWLDHMPHQVVAYPAGNRFPEATAPPPNLAGKIQRNAPLRLLFVGNLIPRKGLHILLKAVSGLPPSYWKLDIVGGLDSNPAYALAMQRFVAQSHWQKQVRFWGTLDHGQLAERYRAAHLLIVPSYYESFGIVYLEAMGFGVPAIGSTGGAAHELITPDVNGYLVDYGDEQRLAQLIEQLHHQRPHLLHLSQAARQRYEQHPTWEESCQKIHHFLHRMRERAPAL